MGTKILYFIANREADEFHLKQGENIIELCIRIEKYATQTFSLHVWKVSDEVKFIISDVDGTITRWEMGDLIGWDSVHEGVIEMYKKITGDNKQFIYVTSRPFKKTLITRKLICDNDLPKGPILTIPYIWRNYQSLHEE
jgi:phosphatidate phosphatase PAH1